MIWAQVIYFVVTLVLSIALSPRPKAPKAAAIEDFEFPTAEEGRPIPVVFGEVDISGPNVLWYGDLSVKPIRKRSGFSKATVGYKYHISFHMGLCHGPVDAVTNIAAGDKEAWSGSVTTSSTITIVADSLFGGDSREGGLNGRVDIMMGDAAQLQNAHLEAQQGGNTPAYRGVLGLVARGGAGGPSNVGMYVGTTAYPKPWKVRVRRILQGWQGGTAWYPAAATIGTVLMNPAHIVYETLTNSKWGLGVDPSLLNEDSFTECADTLLAENFGLALIWNQSATIEQFLQAVFDHIAGTLSFNNSTGKYEMLLIRGDYDVEDLDTYTPSEIIDMVDYQRQGWGETVNTVTVVYTDPDTRKETPITQHDLANIDAQQRQVPAVVELPGIRNHTVARTVLARELATRVTPLSKVTFEINRRAWAVQYGGLFRLEWPEHDINGTVYRVLKVSKGTLTANAIRIDALEDVYALGLQSYLGESPPDTPAAPPSTPTDPEDTGANVISTTQTSPPASPAPQHGDTYFVPSGTSPQPSGAWAGLGGHFVEYDAEHDEWISEVAPDNTLVFDESTGEWYTIVDGQTTAPPWPPVIIQLACSDLTTALTAGTNKAYFRAPVAFTISSAAGVRASLLTGSSSGAVTIDINKNGTTVLSTKLTIDQGETTSVTAATPPVLSTTPLTFARDDLVAIDIDGAGTGAAGLIVTLVGVPG